MESTQQHLRVLSSQATTGRRGPPHIVMWGGCHTPTAANHSISISAVPAWPARSDAAQCCCYSCWAGRPGQLRVLSAPRWARHMLLSAACRWWAPPLLVSARHPEVHLPDRQVQRRRGHAVPRHKHAGCKAAPEAGHASHTRGVLVWVCAAGQWQHEEQQQQAAGRADTPAQ
jgi:hypothetical protein